MQAIQKNRKTSAAPRKSDGPKLGFAMAFNLLGFHEAEKCLDDFMHTDGLFGFTELSVQLLIRSFAKRCPVLSCGMWRKHLRRHAFCRRIYWKVSQRS